VSKPAPAKTNIDFTVVDDVTPYRLIRIMNERFNGVRGFSDKPTQYGYSARKSGTFPSFQRKDDGKWMVTGKDATEYLKKYYERNLAPQPADATAKATATAKAPAPAPQAKTA
jgi:hypothetical protein